MSAEMGERLLNGLGTTLKQLRQNPGMFLSMLNNMGVWDKSVSLDHAIAEPALSTAIADKQVKRVALGFIVRFVTLPERSVGGGTPSPHIGLVVGCLRVPNNDGSVAQGQIRFLVVDHGMFNGSEMPETDPSPVVPVRVCIVPSSEIACILGSASADSDEETIISHLSPSKPLPAPEQGKLKLEFIGTNSSHQLIFGLDHDDGVDVVENLNYDTSSDEGDQGDSKPTSTVRLSTVAYCQSSKRLAFIIADSLRLVVFDFSTAEPTLLAFSKLEFSSFSNSKAQVRVVKLCFSVGHEAEVQHGMNSTSNPMNLYALVEQKEANSTICSVCLVDCAASNVIPLLKLQPQIPVIGFAVLPQESLHMFLENVNQNESNVPSFIIHVDGKGLYIASEKQFTPFALKSKDHLFACQIQDVALNSENEIFVTTFRSLCHIDEAGSVKKLKYLGEEISSLTFVPGLPTLLELISGCLAKVRDPATSLLPLQSRKASVSVIDRMNRLGDEEFELPAAQGVDLLSNPKGDKPGLLAKVAGLGWFQGKRKPRPASPQNAGGEKQQAPPAAQQVEELHYLKPGFEDLLDGLLIGLPAACQPVEGTSAEPPAASLAEPGSPLPLHLRRGVEVPRLPQDPGAQTSPADQSLLAGNFPEHLRPAPPGTTAPTPRAPQREDLRPPASNIVPQGRHGRGFASLEELLRSLGLVEYLARFEAEDMTDMQLLRTLAQDKSFKDTLSELGVNKLGHRMRIIHSLAE